MKQEITFAGPFFARDPSKTVRGNFHKAMVELAQDGKRMVQEGIRPKNATGQTRAGVEAKVYPEYRGGNLYARVRMKPDLKRNPDKGGPRRPYIIAATLESGRRGGYIRVRMNVKTGRTRTGWKSGTRVQTALWMFRNAGRTMKSRVGAIRAEMLTRGIA